MAAEPRPPARRDGRRFEPVLTAGLRAAGGDGRLELVCAGVGLVRGLPTVGQLVRPRQTIGQLEVLGVLHRLVAPSGAHGVVVEVAGGNRAARCAMGFRDVLLVLDAHGAETLVDEEIRAEQAASTGGALVFPSPLTGRFYGRAAPDKEPFVAVGDVIGHGQTVAILEVMKTFNRVIYGGADLPTHARIVGVLAKDEDDLSVGDPLFAIEAAGEGSDPEAATAGSPRTGGERGGADS